MLALVCFVIALSWSVDGFRKFQARIPNGMNVRDPCDGVTIWPGVGHKAMGGTGPRNPFGLSFYANNMVWNTTLCEMDSDGDGVSNGEELGDPDCVWTPGDEPATTPTGHPGICEPWSDPYCLQRNTWYSCQTTELECDAIKRPEVKNFTVTFPETVVPADETTYICMNFEFPSDTDYHVIADKGKIDNQNVMHHLVIYACPIDRYIMTGATCGAGDAHSSGTPDLTFGFREAKLEALKNPLDTPFECGMTGEAGCIDIIAIWSVGAPGFCHHEKAGFLIGRTGYKYGSMQSHWNNPAGVADYKDSSGMVLYYTPVLRDYNLGNLILGENEFTIPPGESSYTIDSECSSVCSERYMNDSIHIISGLNHMHYMGDIMTGATCVAGDAHSSGTPDLTIGFCEGRSMTTSLVPKGGAEQVIMDDPNYTYDNPNIHVFNSPLLLNPGDVLRTKCTFTSKTKVKTTYSGQATSDEMCFAFLVYYPKEAFDSLQCNTWNGIQICSLRSYTDVVDGCQIRSFLENTSMTTEFVAKIDELCQPWTCQMECKEYITEIRQNPCLQGKAGYYIITVLRNVIAADTLNKYNSCNVEIALEVQTCPCATPLPCNPYTGAAASRQTPMYLSLMFVAAFVLFQ